jgi:hypothetical protein
VGAVDFNAWVETVEEQSGTWRILGNTFETDGPGRPIHLASLVARDGALRMVPASAALFQNPRFKLLRRSILLVKAGDPDQPETPAEVRQKIQLLRPAEGNMFFEVSLLGEPKAFSLPRPSDVTFQKEVAVPIPVYPDDFEVDYEIRFDYPEDFDRTGKQAAVYKRSGASDKLCRLLEVAGGTFVGVDVTVAMSDGALRVRPTVEGPAKDAYDLRNVGSRLNEAAGRLDETRRQLVRDYEAKCSRVLAVPLDRFDGSVAQKELLRIMSRREERARFNALLNRIAPDLGGQGEDAFAGWSGEIGKIRDKARQAADGLTPAFELRQLDAEWDRVFRARIRAWFDERAREEDERWAQIGRLREPLKSPVQVVITRLSSPAYTSSGEKHDVLLAMPARDPFHGQTREVPPGDGAARASSFD